MQIYTVSGIEEINEYLTSSMLATIVALQASGKLTEEDAIDFQKTHVAQLVTEARVWTWIRQFLKLEPKLHQVKIFKIIG